MLRGVLLHLASYHLMNHALGVRYRNGFSGDVTAIAQNRHCIAQPENFFQPVRHIDHGDPSFLQLGEQLEEMLAFAD